MGYGPTPANALTVSPVPEGIEEAPVEVQHQHQHQHQHQDQDQDQDQEMVQ